MNGKDRNHIQQEQFEARYKDKKTPWDLGRPDFNLIEAVTQKHITGCKALDIGCGSGHNSIWLAQNGFKVIGVDVAGTALKNAGENASAAKVDCRFLALSFLEQDVPGVPFGFIFDRGCWHILDAEKRSLFARRTAAHLAEGGLWLCLSGSADEPPRGPDPMKGPPRRTVYDIATAMEPHFEILDLKATRFDSNRPKPPRAWLCLMKKRTGAPRGV
jgi:SAM-dependent methyltransferase